MKTGAANCADAKFAWSQGTSLGGSRGSRKGGGRGGRGGGGKIGHDGNKGGNEVTSYCCGQKGHIKPSCPKKDETCRKCSKVGHLQAMCKNVRRMIEPDSVEVVVAKDRKGSRRRPNSTPSKAARVK